MITGTVHVASLACFKDALHLRYLMPQNRTASPCTRGPARLAAAVLHQAPKVLPIHGYRFGQANYQYAPLTQTHHSIGGAAVATGGELQAFINPVTADVPRKAPVHPFFDPDEWRIVIPAGTCVENDPNEPLRLVSSLNIFTNTLPGHSLQARRP